MILGIGTDIVEIVRIGQMIERHGEHFLQRVFTEEEIRYCQRRKESYQHFAGRWAAKEAVMKTLGTGWTKGVGWLDIEVATRRSGQPLINIHGTARDLAGQFGIDEVLISISHCRPMRRPPPSRCGMATLWRRNDAGGRLPACAPARYFSCR